MTRFCLRERGLESRLRTFNTQLMDCLAAPLTDRLEEWRRTVAQLDRENNKEWRRARNELQRVSCEFDKLNKRFRRKGSVSAHPDPCGANSIATDSIGDNVQLNFVQHDLELKQRTLAELERVNLRRAVVEERRRFAELLTCLKPVLESQSALFSDVDSVDECITVITRHQCNPTDLPPDTEQSIEDAVNLVATQLQWPERKFSDVRNAMRFGKLGGSNTADFSRTATHASQLSLQSVVSSQSSNSTAWNVIASSAAAMASAAAAAASPTSPGAVRRISATAGPAPYHSSSVFFSSISTAPAGGEQRNNTLPPPPLPQSPTLPPSPAVENGVSPSETDRMSALSSPNHYSSVSHFPGLGGDALSLFEHGDPSLLSADSTSISQSPTGTTTMMAAATSITSPPPPLPMLDSGGMHNAPPSWMTAITSDASPPFRADSYALHATPSSTYVPLNDTVNSMATSPQATVGVTNGAEAELEDEDEGTGGTTEGTDDGETEDDDDDRLNGGANGLGKDDDVSVAKPRSILYPNQSIPAPVYTNLSELKRAAAKKFGANKESAGDTNNSAVSTPPPTSSLADAATATVESSESMHRTMSATESTVADYNRSRDTTSIHESDMSSGHPTTDGYINTFVNSGTSTFRRRQSEYGRRAQNGTNGGTLTHQSNAGQAAYVYASAVTPGLVRRESPTAGAIDRMESEYAAAAAAPNRSRRPRPANPPRRSSSVSRELTTHHHHPLRQPSASRDPYSMMTTTAYTTGLRHVSNGGPPQDLSGGGIQRVSSSIFAQPISSGEALYAQHTAWASVARSAAAVGRLPDRVSNGIHSTMTGPLTPPPLASAVMSHQPPPMTYSKPNQLMFGVKVLPNADGSPRGSMVARTQSQRPSNDLPLRPPPLGSPVSTRRISGRMASRELPVVQAPVDDAVTSKDIVGIAETGSGKTGAFLIPILQHWITAGRPLGFALILVPTRELAQQLAEEATRLGSKAADAPAPTAPKTKEGDICVLRLVGGEDVVEQALQLAWFKHHIIIATPGRFVDHIRQTKTFARQQLSSIRQLVLDEADRMLNLEFAEDIDLILGYFQKPALSSGRKGKKRRRGDKLTLLERISLEQSASLHSNSIAPRPNPISEKFEHPQTHLYSATMTKDIAKLRRAALTPEALFVTIDNETNADSTNVVSALHGGPNESEQEIKIVKTGFPAGLLHYCLPLRLTDKPAVLDWMLEPETLNQLQTVTGDARIKMQSDSKVIVFCKRCQETRLVAGFLRERGHSVVALTGRMKQANRKQALLDFSKSHVTQSDESDRCHKPIVLIATDVASRGLDIANVDLVINYTVPLSDKCYRHRVGRTARAGRTGVAVTLITRDLGQVFLDLEAAVTPSIRGDGNADPPDVIPQWPIALPDTSGSRGMIARRRRADLAWSRAGKAVRAEDATKFQLLHDDDASFSDDNATSDSDAQASQSAPSSADELAPLTEEIPLVAPSECIPTLNETRLNTSGTAGLDAARQSLKVTNRDRKLRRQEFRDAREARRVQQTATKWGLLNEVGLSNEADRVEDEVGDEGPESLRFEETLKAKYTRIEQSSKAVRKSRH